MKIAKTYRFEAAHRLEGWLEEHKCHRLHGHSYKVEVEVSGPVARFGNGAIVDFGELDECWKPLFRMMDHKYLNDVYGEKNLTAEYLAERICTHFRSWHFTNPEAHITRVRVWETENAWAEFTP